MGTKKHARHSIQRALWTLTMAQNYPAKPKILTVMRRIRHHMNMLLL